MAALIASLPAMLQSLQPPRAGESLSGVFGSVSLTAWICLLVGYSKQYGFFTGMR